MSTLTDNKPTEKLVLAKALLSAAKALGLTQDQTGKVIGRDRSSISRGVDPESKAGELALLLIRAYRGLFLLLGGEDTDLKHWTKTYNNHLNGVPVELVQTVDGLASVVMYLDAVRGKV